MIRVGMTLLLQVSDLDLNLPDLLLGLVYARLDRLDLAVDQLASRRRDVAT